ncbi:MFS transporter [Inquilinus sp. Marseille-Q2685]|uniref:MFS transporter n=1 Tax=Inquilinus sp. Marseille-Q2685 TaxID=2866581 RepID=UPI001CE45DD4|nr:MFS transporter [Inquilinus sp. Marseille-Q2685]
MSRPVNRWAILPVVSVALLLVAIDATVLHIAVPTLTLALAPSAPQLLWIIDIYPLLMAGLLPAAGTLGDRIGHKRMLLLGLALFGLASAACAFAPGPEWLIAGRAFLAFGGAMMMPATLSILRLAFDDPRERAIAIGIWSSVASGGAAFGPVVGGALLEHSHWGAVFLINVPIVLAALPFAAWLLPGRRESEQHPWDLPGLLMAMAGIIAVVYAVKQTTHAGADPWAAIAIGLAGAALVAAFLRRQARAAAPMIDLSLFRDLGIAVALAGAMVAMIIIVGFELLLSQQLQLVLGLSPLQAGLRLAPVPLASFLASPLAGGLVHRFGFRATLAGALGLSATGFVGIALLPPGSVSAATIASFAAIGAGVGAAMTAASTTVMNSAPAHQAGAVASVEEVAYELGGGLGVALFGSLMAVLYQRLLVLPPLLEKAAPAARRSIGEALLAAETLAAPEAGTVTAAARAAFSATYQGVSWVAAGLLAVTAVTALIVLARRRAAAQAG